MSPAITPGASASRAASCARSTSEWISCCHSSGAAPTIKCARHVCVIALDLRAAVDHKKISHGELAVTGAVMRQRGILPTSDDGGKRSILRPPFGKSSLEPTSNVRLAVTNGDGVGNLLEGPGGDVTGARQRV